MDFIEHLIGWDPDAGNGSIELALILLANVAIFLFVLRDLLRGKEQ
jgi:hypothetical protein